MESQHRETKTVSLVLDEREAGWLKGIMQNPLHAQDPSDEDRHDKEMRLRFWTALSNN